MSLKHTKETHPQWGKNEHHIQRNYLLPEQMFKTVKNKQKTNSFVIYSPCFFFFRENAAVDVSLSKSMTHRCDSLQCCCLATWLRWQVLHTLVLWQITEICVDLASCSHLFSKSQQNVFSTKQQVLPDLCAEWAVIRYNLLAVILNHEDNKLVILLPRAGCFFFSHQLPLTTVLSSLLTSLYFFTLFCSWLAPFFLVLTLIWSLLFSLSIVIISQVLS